MDAEADYRRLALWEGVPPDQMWKRQRAAIDQMVGTMFDPDRPRAVVQIRDPAPAANPGKD